MFWYIGIAKLQQKVETNKPELSGCDTLVAWCLVLAVLGNTFKIADSYSEIGEASADLLLIFKAYPLPTERFRYILAV